jgi:hypothetical protein
VHRLRLTAKELHYLRLLLRLKREEYEQLKLYDLRSLAEGIWVKLEAKRKKL